MIAKGVCGILFTVITDADIAPNHSYVNLVNNLLFSIDPNKTPMKIEHLDLCTSP